MFQIALCSYSIIGAYKLSFMNDFICINVVPSYIFKFDYIISLLVSFNVTILF